MKTAVHLSTHFVDGARGKIHVTLRRPSPGQSETGGVLFLPPFAEELNKSRRQMTETAVRLGNAGKAVLIVDLFGTGDSQGDFGAANWRTWQLDLVCAVEWANSVSVKIDSLIGIRLGCALGSELARAVGANIFRTVFWQPVVAGKTYLEQILKVRLAHSRMAGVNKENIDSLRSAWASGVGLDIGGYSINSEMAHAIESINLVELTGREIGNLHIVESIRVESPILPANVVPLCDEIRAKGVDVTCSTVPGQYFWRSSEIIVNLTLVKETVEFIVHN